MNFEWDEAKAISNLQKHGFSFEDATDVFGDPRAITFDVTRPEHGEQRLKLIGTLNGHIVVVIFTFRGGARRIISVRRSRQSEQGIYFSNRETFG